MPAGVNQHDMGADYWDNAPSAVPGFTNRQLADAMAASQAANPQATFGPSPTVNYAEAQTQAAPQGAPVPTDWSSYLGIYGLPADVINELNAIFNRTPDVTQAVQLALAYVRGTDWYRVTYPGIQEALAKGIVRNEADYRANMNAFNQVYQQYAQRDITSDEYAAYLREGIGVDVLGKRFQGSALEQTYGNDWQYLSGAFAEGPLSGEEKQAYGRQQAGLDSPLGLKVQRRLQMAQDRIRSVFSGQLATGKLASLSQSGESPPDVSR